MIDKSIGYTTEDLENQIKQQVKVEPEVMVNFADIQKEYEEKFRHLDENPKLVYSKYSISDLWEWFEQKLKEVSKKEITLDLIMYHTVKQCQTILAKWIVPDSGIRDKDCLTELLGLLDDQSLVRYMRTIEENLKDKNGKP